MYTYKGFGFLPPFPQYPEPKSGMPPSGNDKFKEEREKKYAYQQSIDTRIKYLRDIINSMDYRSFT